MSFEQEAFNGMLLVALFGLVAVGVASLLVFLFS